MKAPECVDCLHVGVERWRPVTGKRVKRCATHVRERRQAEKLRKRQNSRLNNYGLTPEEYEELKEYQGGLCAICGPVTGNRGASRDLSTDHDHACCRVPPTCGACTRGLLCGTCNTYLGRVGDDPEVGKRMAEYLIYPPMKRLRNREVMRHVQQ